jgi:NADH:ubiquinone oxidoreductase subunit B-like Fe-S oxidoreductase
MGCPPRPDTLIRAVMELQKKIEELAIDGRRSREPAFVQ